MTSMLADPGTKTTMGVGLDTTKARRTADPEAWKRAIGTKPVAARLALLPEGKPRWGRVGLSAGAQIIIVGFVLLMPLLYPEHMLTSLKYDIVEIASPVTMVPVAPPPPPPPKIREKVAPKAPEPPVVEPPKLNPKQPHIFATPKVIQPKVQTVDVKAPEMAPVLEAAKIDTTSNQPKRPKEDVKLNNLSGSAAPATVKAPVEKVQTGGFGDPTGLAGKGDPNKSNIVNRLGSPALPGGPGYGNGTGGDKGIKGAVASTGFGNGTANPPQGGGKRGTVQASGFGDQTVAAEAPKKVAASTEGATTQVDITEKPRPEYTAEGRSLRIEGDVVLDLIFLANGTVQVKDVASGLGHGLDEAATRAAQQIKFKPAKRDGQPVDLPARVRIQFRLAY
jgi:TonB family protein